MSKQDLTLLELATMSHTPLPWRVVDNGNGTLSIGAEEDGGECRPARVNGNAIEEPYATITRANADFIVLACNAHEKLLEACKRLLAYDESGTNRPGSADGQKLLDAIQMARNAIAKMETTT